MSERSPRDKGGVLILGVGKEETGKQGRAKQFLVIEDKLLAPVNSLNDQKEWNYF